MLNWLTSPFKKIWAKIRKFFNDSEVIALSYLHAIGGFVVGALNYFDWNKFLGLIQSVGVSKTQAFYVAAALFVQGIVFYVARKARATDV